MRRFFVPVFILFMACATSHTDYRARMQPEIKSNKAKQVADITFKIPSASVREYYYRFAPGDTIVLNAWVIKGNDISSVEVQPYGGSAFLNFVRMPYILNKTFVSDTGGIYVIRFSNTSTFKSKIYRFTIHRIPSISDYTFFNTSVFWDTIYDTTYKWVRESTLVKYNLEPERILFRGVVLNKGGHRCIKIDVPRATSYVAYMVGVGQGFLEGMGEFSGKSPLELFERGEILRPRIRRERKPVSIDYAIDYSVSRAVKFFTGSGYNPLRGEKNIIVDFGRLYISSDCYLCVKNNSHEKDVNVFADVIAVRKVGVYSYRRVRKPFVKVYRVPK